MRYNVHEAKTQFSKLLNLATSGEEVVIVRHGRPIVRLEPIEIPTGRVLGLAQGEFELPETGWQGPLTDQEVDDLVEGR